MLDATKCICGQDLPVHKYLGCGPAGAVIQGDARDEANSIAKRVAARCAEIADKWPHRKGYGVADAIREEFGLERPANRPIDKWRRGE